jgi:hypothetical protein
MRHTPSVLLQAQHRVANTCILQVMVGHTHDIIPPVVKQLERCGSRHLGQRSQAVTQLGRIRGDALVWVVQLLAILVLRLLAE